MTPRHLAIFLPALASGGAEKVLLWLAESLVLRGIRTDLVLARPEGELLEHVPEGVRVIPLNRRTSRKSIFALARYVRRERPDTLLSSLYRANVAAIIAGKLAARPTRLVIREANHTEFLIGASTQQSRIDNFLIARIYPKADCVIAVSQSIRDSMIARELSAPSLIKVIHNPITVRAVQKSARATVPDVPILVACGRLSPQKDYSTLLRAFALLRARKVAKLVVLGEGPLRQSLESQAIELNIRDDVSLPGYVTDPMPFFREGSVFVHTSRFEGLPNVLLQALAAGCPIVATDCPGGVREALGDGKFGSLVEVGNDQAIADAVNDILSGAVRFPDAGQHLQHFDSDRITSQYIDALFPSDDPRNSLVRVSGEYIGRSNA